MKLRLALALLLLSSAAFAQHLVSKETFNAIAQEYSGEAAQEYTRQIIQYHRIQGSPMMAEVAEKVVLAKLKAWGIESKLEQFPSDGKTRYGTFTSPMAWDMRSGELWVESVAGQKDFVPVRLCRYSDVPMCVSTYSKGGEWSGELVDVGSGTSDKDYEEKDVSGKVALASGYAANVVRQAVLKHGAVGVVIYPDALDRPDHPDMVRYNGIWPRAEELEKTAGGFQISANQYAQLKALMRQGAVRVRGKIDATLGAGSLTLVHAYIRGTEHPEQEIVLVAHLDHPKWSANDNASGSGAMLETARTLNALIKSGRLPAPKRTIHFLWVPEYFGTLAYVTNHPETRACGAWDDPRPAVKPWTAKQACVIAALNLDMVGEDTVKTNSRFYFTRTPDSVPSFLNALMSDALAQTREANLYAPTGTRNLWVPEEIGLALGSDHEVFLGLGIPATMLGHDPDWTHHTSEDTADKTDASEFRRTGVLAAVVAWWMTSATPEDYGRAFHSEELRLLAASQWKYARLAIHPSATRWMKSTGEIVGGMEHENLTNIASAMMAHLGRQQEAITGKKTQPALSAPSNAYPRRKTLLPIDGSAMKGLNEADKAWVEQQQKRFSADSEGISDKADFNLLLWETINLMDGNSGSARIATVLSSEYLIEVDEAWVDRLVGILAAQKLVAK